MIFVKVSSAGYLPNIKLTWKDKLMKYSGQIQLNIDSSLNHSGVSNITSYMNFA